MKKWGLLIILIVLAVFGVILKKHSPQDELVFWTLQMRDFAPYMEKVIHEFEDKNPEIKIKWVDIPFSEGEKRTLAAILSDTPPDLVNLNPDFSSLLAQKGTLTEIPDDRLNQFPQEIINSVKIHDKNYFIPWYATSALTFYNKKFLKHVPKTYDEVFALCEAGVKKPILMFNFAENDSTLKLLNKYGVTGEFNSLPAINLLTNIQNAYTAGCFPKESLTQTHRESLEKYMAEEVMMFEGGSNFLNLIKENAPKTFENTAISSQLVGDSGKYNFSMMNFIIPIKSKKQKEALEFALFLTNKENQLELAKLTNILATNKDALADEFYTKAPEDDIFAQARVLSAKQLKKIQPQTFYPHRKEFITRLNNAVQKILLKQDTIESILNKLRIDSKRTIF